MKFKFNILAFALALAFYSLKIFSNSFITAFTWPYPAFYFYLKKDLLPDALNYLHHLFQKSYRYYRLYKETDIYICLPADQN